MCCFHSNNLDRSKNNHVGRYMFLTKIICSRKETMKDKTKIIM